MRAGEVKDDLAQKDRARVLRDELAYHEHRYHVLESPLISRGRYFALRTELEALEAGGVEQALGSSTRRRPPSPRSAFVEVTPETSWVRPETLTSEHGLRLYHTALVSADPRAGVCIGSAWLSGVRVALAYSGGELQKALLLGEGSPIDVIDNVRTIGSVPLSLRPAGSVTESRVTRLTQEAIGPSTMTPVPPAPKTLWVRGTLTMRVLDLLALDRNRVDAGDPPYLSARAAVEASVRRLDAGVTAARRLELFVEDTAELPEGIETHWQLLGALKSWGFKVTPLSWRCETYEEVLDFISMLKDERPSFAFPIEGGALRVNRSGFVVAEDAPPMPHKLVELQFQTASREVSVRRIYKAVGRGGVVFPVALLHSTSGAPEGVPIPAVTGDSMLELQAGENVRLVPGAIAPVIERIGAASRASRDEACPSCGSPLDKPVDEPFDCCTNSGCVGRGRARVLHSVGPRGLALSGLTPEVVQALVDSGVTGLSDVFELDADRLRAAGGLDATIAAIRALGPIPLWRLLYLASIPHVSERFARQLARRAKTSDGLFVLGEEAPPELGREAWLGFRTWLSTEAQSTLARLSELGIEVLDDAASFSAPFFAKKIVLAGTLRARERWVELIERGGGRLQPRISRMTHLVVLGEESQDAAETAVHYGTPTIDEATLSGLAARLDTPVPT